MRLACRRKVAFTQRSVNQDGAVELRGGTGDANRCHLVKHSQRVTPWQQLRYVFLPQDTSNQEHHIVNHVAIPMATEKEQLKILHNLTLLSFAH